MSLAYGREWQAGGVTQKNSPQQSQTPALAYRSWVPEASETYVAEIAQRVAASSSREVQGWIDDLVAENLSIHDQQSVNLNPATNTMNPRAEAMLSAGLGARPSLGYPGAKYEMGLEAIEQIEIITAELAAQVFEAEFAEIRVPSGAIANMYAFMALANPGDAIIVPPATIAGHVTHQQPGCAGLYGLEIHEAPIDAATYTVDVAALGDLAERVQPKVISIGCSLNLEHHDVAGIRRVADSVGAKVLFDAAHLSGVIAGKAWPNPLREGAHVMTMSTYKSLAGPPSGLLVTNDAEIAQRVDAIAFPGMTANFDAAKSAALSVTLLDWVEHGENYGRAMVDVAVHLAQALADAGVDVHRAGDGHTRSHAFALRAGERGGDATTRHLRRANLLTCAIGLPDGTDAGVRIGTNEMVRWGMGVRDVDELAELIMLGLNDEPEAVAARVSDFRRRFDSLHYVIGDQRPTGRAHEPASKVVESAGT